MDSMHETQLSLRKNQNNLVVIGLGVIAFGVWSTIKAVLYTAFNTESLLGESAGDNLVTLALWIIMAFILAIDLSLRLYVGLNAIAEGRERKRKTGYIVMALLMALGNFVSVAAELYFIRSTESIGTVIVTIVVDLTSGIMLTEMVVSAIRAKQLHRMIIAGSEC